MPRAECRKILTLYGIEGKRSVDALFDTGSSDSFLREEIADRLGPRIELPEPKRFEMLRGTFVVHEAFVGDVGLARHRQTGLFYIVPHLSEELLLGADFLQRWHIKFEPRRRRIEVDPKALRLTAVMA